MISFTSSTLVGRGLAAKAGLKGLALELGGNGPLGVLNDADLERAVECAVFGSYDHQGQICMATNRVIIDDSVIDGFVERFIEQAHGLRTGDPGNAHAHAGTRGATPQVSRVSGRPRPRCDSRDLSLRQPHPWPRRRDACGTRPHGQARHLLGADRKRGGTGARVIP
ncbi:aldehyde dehydrogenase family protein [Streptomyces sp. NBC_00271]|uniref:aldehyde dehydrogenase family protein n=1 Tax=Streptomyces sp. NBC_00271 TaxID=2975697 RepID=UPI003FA69C70